MLQELTSSVTTPDGSTYPVSFIGGSLDSLAGQVSEHASGRIIVVSDANVSRLYGKALVRSLTELGRQARILQFSAGESHKTMSTVEALWAGIFAEAVDRGDTIVALGGGVVGDVAGFIASTVMRGIRFVQCPTTVLAMSDAAIGGKTGVNTAFGKNLVGSFYQPKAVVAWTPSLATLSDREVRSGLAEVVKSALLSGESELRTLEKDAPALAKRAPDALHRAAAMAARVKCEIVSNDIHERGNRALLNLGHTFGHAIEHASGYGTWTHGEAVAAGIVLALRYSATLDWTTDALTERVKQLQSSLGLPNDAPPLSIDDWMDPILRDKKRSGEQVKLVLCRGIGNCVTHATDLTTLKSWLSRHAVPGAPASQEA